MRRLLIFTTGFLAVMALFSASAMADSPHFVSATVTSVGSNSVTVSFRESGLDHSLNSVNIVVTGTAECINGGGNHPKATNKTSESTSGPFNVSNGTAAGSLKMYATNISPPCSPPMVIAWTNLVVTDTTTHDSTSIPGTFYPGG